MQLKVNDSLQTTLENIINKNTIGAYIGKDYVWTQEEIDALDLALSKYYED